MQFVKFYSSFYHHWWRWERQPREAFSKTYEGGFFFRCTKRRYVHMDETHCQGWQFFNIFFFKQVHKQTKIWNFDLIQIIKWILTHMDNWLFWMQFVKFYSFFYHHWWRWEWQPREEFSKTCEGVSFFRCTKRRYVHVDEMQCVW